LAESIIRKGIESGDLKLDVLELSRLKSSQQGSFNHRHKGLLYRINRAKKKESLFPRSENDFFVDNILLNIIQYLRMKVRAQSLEIWTKVRNVDDFNAEY
jgi:hypothetical protein